MRLCCAHSCCDWSVRGRGCAPDAHRMEGCVRWERTAPLFLQQCQCMLTRGADSWNGSAVRRPQVQSFHGRQRSCTGMRARPASQFSTVLVRRAGALACSLPAVKLVLHELQCFVSQWQLAPHSLCLLTHAWLAPRRFAGVRACHWRLSTSTHRIRVLLHCALLVNSLAAQSFVGCLPRSERWCVGVQPFLIGAFSNFTTPMIILGAMDLAAAVMLLCAHPLQRCIVCPFPKDVDFECQYPRIGVGPLLTWTGLLLQCPPVHALALRRHPSLSQTWQAHL